jgi:hypothetical protein
MPGQCSSSSKSTPTAGGGVAPRSTLKRDIHAQPICSDHTAGGRARLEIAGPSKRPDCGNSHDARRSARSFHDGGKVAKRGIAHDCEVQQLPGRYTGRPNEGVSRIPRRIASSGYLARGEACVGPATPPKFKKRCKSSDPSGSARSLYNRCEVEKAGVASGAEARAPTRGSDEEG